MELRARETVFCQAVATGETFILRRNAYSLPERKADHISGPGFCYFSYEKVGINREKTGQYPYIMPKMKPQGRGTAVFT